MFDLPPRARVLLVHGGSQGAASLNDIVAESFGRSLRVRDPDGVHVQVNENDRTLYT